MTTRNWKRTIDICSAITEQVSVDGVETTCPSISNTLVASNQDWARFSDTATKLDITEIIAETHRETRPMKMSWWYSLGRLDPDKAVQILIDHIPVKSQIILGGPLDKYHPEQLPSDWEHNSLMEVYVNLTRNSFNEVYQPYCGSASGSKGIHGRLSTYQRWRQNGLPREAALKPSRHELRIVDPDVVQCLRIVGVFEQSETNLIAYIYLLEFCISALLNCFNNTKVGYFATPAARALVKAGRPNDLPKIVQQGLNDATQILQHMRIHRAEKVCDNCGSEHTADWYPAVTGILFGKVICSACYSHKKKHGTSRPKHLIEWAKKRYTKMSPKPEDGKCTECHVIIKKHQWHRRPVTQEWVCNTCYSRARRLFEKHNGPQAPIWKQAPRPGKLPLPKVPKVKRAEKPTVCPVCKKVPTRWLGNTADPGDMDPSIMPWICRPCYEHKFNTKKVSKLVDAQCGWCRVVLSRWRLNTFAEEGK